MPVAYTALDPALAHPVAGVRFAAVQAGVRKVNRYDLLLAQFDEGTTVGGVFTQSRFAAAPVQVCREHLAAGSAIRALVVNTGIANAATGELGLTNARASCASVAAALGVAANQVLPFSTGVILEHLPMDRIGAGINAAASEIKAGKLATWDRVAQTIMTTDTVYKLASTQATVGGKTISVTGIAKGAGMIQPNMATMLAFLATDFSVPRSFLQKILSEAVTGTFNCITVDGDMSTNDTVLMLANGHSGVSVGDKSPRELRVLFAEAVWKACEVLADKIVSDGEKITKVVEVKVTGAASAEDAEKVARAIGNSLLVKSSWYGEDPNWGRLADAAGYAGAKLVEAKLDILYNDTPAMTAGKPHAELKPKWKEIVKARRFTITLNLHLGKASFRLLATDLTEGYVNYNKSE